MRRLRELLVYVVAGIGLLALTARAEEFAGVVPDASIDLATREGVALVRGPWRYADARIVEVDFRSPGPDRKPSGPPNRTYDLEPKAGARDFDDSGWRAIEADTLDDRRGTGKVAFCWYRIRIAIPERIGAFDPTGSTVVFQTTVDDYAEVWVDGQLPRELGRSSGALVRGWNVPNRLVIGRDVKPGQEIQLAVFAMNGPLSDAPSNFIWVREARLEFLRQPQAQQPAAVDVRVVRLHPGLDALVPPKAKLERVARGFAFTEGPVWSPAGSLLFSDPNRNAVYRWSPSGELALFRSPSGYDGADLARYTQPGSNGLAFDREGRLVLCEHGNRRVTRLEPDGRLFVLADRYQGKRLNSPNDLVFRSDGALYFTDPPFGLPRFHDDPARELDFTGVFLLREGRLEVVSRELSGPNGLAFSPDEKLLYVTNWDPRRKVVMRYAVDPDGRLRDGRVLFDMSSAPEPEALDGIEVDARGDLYVSGPGGVWVLSPEGHHLGTIVGPELPANFAWGDADRRTLYMTARTGVYRMRLGVPGAGTPDVAGVGH